MIKEFGVRGLCSIMTANLPDFMFNSAPTCMHLMDLTSMVCSKYIERVNISDGGGMVTE